MIAPEKKYELTQHEWHQIYHIDRVRKIIGLKEVQNLNSYRQGESVKETVIALAENYQFEEATELLFGAHVNENAPLPHGSVNIIGFEIFQLLWNGIKNNDVEKIRNLLKEIAEYHHWSDKSEWEGCSIQVYSDEWLIIEEPAGSKAIRLFLNHG